MAIVSGVVNVAGLPRNGAEVRIYQASAFGTPPQKGTPFPPTGLVAQTTTGPSHGGDGHYRFTTIGAGDYYIGAKFAGQFFWDGLSVSGASTVVNPWTNVQQEGVPADGVADAAAPLETLINNLATSLGETGRETLLFPAGTYRMAKAGTIIVPPQIGFWCEPGAKFRRAVSHASPIFTFQGSTTTPTTTLTTTGVEGAFSITVASSSGFAVGDRVLIYDATTHGVSGAGPNEEINVIRSISGTTIVLENALVGTYSTAFSATVVKLRAYSQEIVGGEYIVPEGLAGGLIAVELAYECKIRGLTLSGPDNVAALRIARSREVTVKDCTIERGQNNTITDRARGLLLEDACYEVTIDNLYATALRDNVIRNYCRNVRVLSSTFEGAEDVGLAVLFSGNRRILIRGCTFRHSNNGLALGRTTGSGLVENDHSVAECIFTNNSGTHLSVTRNASATARGVRIIGCMVHDVQTGGTGRAAMSLSNWRGVVVLGNRISGNDTGGLEYGIRLQTCDRAMVSANVLEGITAGTPYAISVEGGTGSTVVGNHADQAIRTATSPTAAYVIGNQASTYSFVTGTRAALNQEGTGSPHRFHIGSTEQVQIDDSGRLRIGLNTETPLYKLDVFGTTNDSQAAGIRLRNTSTGASADCGILLDTGSGGSRPHAVVRVNPNAASTWPGRLELSTSASSAATGIVLDATGSGTQNIVFRTGGSTSERLRISSSGEVLVNTTSNLATLAAVGTASGQVVLRARAAAGQTALVLQVETSAASILFAIDHNGRIRTNQFESGSVGTHAGRIPVYDPAGTLLGYIAIYNAP